MGISTIQNACNSFFEKNDFSDLCRVMYQATNQNLFSAPSLGLVKKGSASRETLPTCPALMTSISWNNVDAITDDFFKKIYNRPIHKWEPGELESYQPQATSKINQIAKQLGFNGDVNIYPRDEEACAEFGEIRHVTQGISACKPFYRDLIGLNGLELQQEAEGIVAHEIGHKAFLDDVVSKKNDEIRADLYTLRNSLTARGNLNAMKRLQKLFPLEIEVSIRGSDPSHPYLFERIQYLNEGLCGLYSEQNQDIC